MVVLFDLGSVLVKPVDPKKLYKKLKVQIPYEKFLNYWFNGFCGILTQRGLMSDLLRVKRLLRHCKSDKSPSEFFKIYKSLRPGTYKDTLDIISNLKKNNIKVGILSNTTKTDVNIHKTYLDFSMFDNVFLSYVLHKMKPNLNIYKVVIKKLGCKPSNIIFFDDNLENVNNAKKLGIIAYQVTGDNIKEIVKNLKVINKFI